MVKKTCFLVIIIFLNTHFISASYMDFSTLDLQIKNNIHNITNFNNAKKKLNDYLSLSNAEIKLGMKMILLENLYRPYYKFSPSSIAIDGNNNEWKILPEFKDKTGDAPYRSSDLISFKYFISKNHDLYVMLKTKGKPQLKNKTNGFYVWIRPDYSPETKISFMFGWYMNRMWVYVKKEGQSKSKRLRNVEFEYKIDNIAEAKIPLKTIFKAANLKLANEYFINAGVRNNGSTKRWDYLNRYENAFKIHKNYALELLIHLLKNNCYEKGDPISLALALANNQLYSIADRETKNEIKKDIIKHYNLYRKILKWQTKQGIKYNLKNAGVISKIFWAYRKRNMDRVKWNEKLNLKKYKIFIDRIETLSAIHREIAGKNFFNAPTLKQSAYLLERYVKSKNKYRCKIEAALGMRNAGIMSNKRYQQMLREIHAGLYKRFYLGKKRRWDQFSWLNHLYGEYKNKGYFTGDCGSVTTMQMAFYKMAGIPSLSLQRKPVYASAYSHNFPAYYNVFFNKWDCVQIPKFKNIKLYFYYSKPIWHHKNFNRNFKSKGRQTFYSYYQGEISSTKEIRNLLTKGIEKKHLQKLFLSFKTMESGLIFNSKTAPAVLHDTDGDGIYDIHERKIGTNPSNADTDNDGYSDLYEIEHGFNANNANSPENKNIAAIDGIALKYIIKNNLPTLFSKKNDYKATSMIYDIKSLSYKVLKNNLYFAVTYHNDILKNKFSIHSFAVQTRGNGNKEYWIQWYKGRPNFFLRIRRPRRKNKLIKIAKSGLYFNQIKDAEFLIPLKYFKGVKVIYIKYYAGGMKNNKRIITSDSSKMFRINLRPDNLFKTVKNKLKNVSFERDEQYDAKGNKEIYDIKNYKFINFNNYLLFYSNFHNNTTLNEFGAHSFSIRDTEKKKRWWIQFIRPSYCVMRIFQNNTKKRVVLSIDNFDVIRYKQGLIFIINKKLFRGTNKAKIRYYTSSRDNNGKRIFTADRTEYKKLSIH